MCSATCDTPYSDSVRGVVAGISSPRFRIGCVFQTHTQSFEALINLRFVTGITGPKTGIVFSVRRQPQLCKRRQQSVFGYRHFIPQNEGCGMTLPQSSHSDGTAVAIL